MTSGVGRALDCRSTNLTSTPQLVPSPQDVARVEHMMCTDCLHFVCVLQEDEIAYEATKEKGL
jgi:hypothetical protein